MVIDYSPASSGLYVGSPGIAITVFQKALVSGEALEIRQGNWTGGIVLIPGE